MSRITATATLGLAILLGSAGGPATAEDLHVLWDRQCGGCHGHAGDFARDSLRVVDGRLVGARLGDGVEAFLATHNGGYSPEVVAAMTGMLRAQLQTPDLFRSHCADCHGLAAQFVREQLVERDGRLVGRYSGAEVEATLARHGGLDDGQATLMLRVLERIEREVHRR